MNARRLLTIALAICSLSAGVLGAEEYLLVNATEDAVVRNGFTKLRRLGATGPFLVRRGPGASVESLRRDAGVDNVEADGIATLQRAAPGRLAGTAPAENPYAIDRTPMPFYGGLAWAGYVYQPAGGLIGTSAAHESGATGRGVVVAIIDTGVDPDHPMLAGALLPGYDFTRDRVGASELADLDVASAAIMDVASAAIMDVASAAIMDASGVAVLDVASAAIMDGSGAAALAVASAAIMDGSSIPPAFGHGTLVAGLVHLVSPEARILPLKAFDADGFSTVSDIVEAIHYAVDNGADVINMSFHSDSLEILRAVSYASRRGVICVSSVGNEGVGTPVLPAALPWVVGVASTTLADTRAPFSNYGQPNVKVAAPGVDLITAYPGGFHAAASGTSFSTGLVSGGIALMQGVNGDLARRELRDALRASQFLTRDLGYGRIDLLGSLAQLN